VDHRLVRERYIDYISHRAAALYLFLVTVSDAKGLSYYGDETLQKRLCMDTSLSDARDALVQQRLIAYKKPLYQVLALDHRRVKQNQVATEPCSMQEVLQQVMGGGA